MRRILASYRKEGVAALAHGNRGRQPAHTIAQDVRERVLRLAQSTYAGANQSHLRDLLAEREGLILSRASVRRILLEGHVISGQERTRPVHRRRRKRFAKAGMLIQIDGSPHAWLEERGPRMSLLAASDDATGKVVAAVFRKQEDAHGYFLLVQQLVTRLGRPLALYHDRHSTFQPTKPASRAERIAAQLEGKNDQQAETQFGRLLQELNITSIAAHSPTPPKAAWSASLAPYNSECRIELRLAQATTLDQANAFLEDYLPRFNGQFAVTAEQEALAYRPLPDTFEAQSVFCFKYERIVGADHVVRFGTQRLQLQPDQLRRSYVKAKVEVHERLDGSLAVCYQGRSLTTTSAPLETSVVRTRPEQHRPQTTSLSEASPASPVEPEPPKGDTAVEDQQRGGTTMADVEPEPPKKDTASVRSPNSPWRKGPMIRLRTFSLDT